MSKESLKKKIAKKKEIKKKDRDRKPNKYDRELWRPHNPWSLP